MKTSEKFSIGMIIVFLIIGILGAIGWVMNIIHLVHATGLSGMVVARAIGILVAPLGAILGWF